MSHPQPDHAPQRPSRGLSQKGRRNWMIGAVVLGIISGLALVFLAASMGTLGSYSASGLLIDIAVVVIVSLLIYGAVAAIVNAVVRGGGRQ